MFLFPAFLCCIHTPPARRCGGPSRNRSAPLARRYAEQSPRSKIMPISAVPSLGGLVCVLVVTRHRRPCCGVFRRFKLCYIRCAECKPDVDLCVGCFFAGQEPGEHKKTHKYRVMEKLNKPIFSGECFCCKSVAVLDWCKTWAILPPTVVGCWWASPQQQYGPGRWEGLCSLSERDG